MKKLLCLLILFLLSNFAQDINKNLKIIKASVNKADYMINGVLTKGQWNISPELKPDVLELYSTKSVNFKFITDKDSISCKLNPGESKQFYVLLNDKDYALTEFRVNKYETVNYDENPTKFASVFIYENDVNNDYLKTLREKYQLDKVIEGCSNDLEKVKKILAWTNKQWKHNGSNEPSKSDALTILEEVKQGKNFRCVEYGIVSAAALNSIGLKARVVGLKTKDVETRASGAGHVVAEVYLNDYDKWVFIDGQWNVLPVVEDVPLNAVEFQDAIVNNFEELDLTNIPKEFIKNYTDWIFPYLYYIDVDFDNLNRLDKKAVMVDGKRKLMLVPKGAKNPEIMQRKFKIDYCHYTNSTADIYAKPIFEKK